MSEDVKFWYPVVKTWEPYLTGGGHYISAVAAKEPGHIYTRGALLCGTYVDTILKRTSAKPFILANRKDDVPLCKECQERYKQVPHLAWAKWAKAAAEV